MLSERTGTEMCINQCLCVHLCALAWLCVKSEAVEGAIFMPAVFWEWLEFTEESAALLTLERERTEEEMGLCVCVCAHRWRTFICCSMCGLRQKKCFPNHNQHPSEARLTSPTDKRLNASLNHPLLLFSLSSHLLHHPSPPFPCPPS